MSDDYRVHGRSNLECRELAKKAREFFNVSDARHVDVLGCLSAKHIWTAKGIRRLNFQIRPDSEMGTKEGVTSYGKDVVSIAIKQSVADKARLGIGRDRLTCAHELGHGVMHEGPPLFRLVTGNKTPAWIEPYRSAEHQAKLFSPAFLINDDLAKALTTAEELSVEFGISLECATIYLE